MNIKTIIHDAEEGGYWAEVPAIPGCVSQGETMEELLINLREAIAGCLAIDVAPTPAGRSRKDFGFGCMRPVSGPIFAKLVERRGWQLLRVNGSHHIYGREGSILRLTIPIHGMPI